MNRMIGTVAILASSALLLGAKASPKAEPKATFSVPAACADVYAQVYTELDPSWQVTVLDATRADESVPTPDELFTFVSVVPGLDKAVEKMDAADRDIFFIRVKTRTLGELKKKYPAIDAKVLEAAKVQACRDAAAR